MGGYLRRKRYGIRRKLNVHGDWGRVRRGWINACRLSGTVGCWK